MDLSVSDMEESSIDYALVAVLHIFAARGRAIREERERLIASQALVTCAPDPSLTSECAPRNEEIASEVRTNISDSSIPKLDEAAPLPRITLQS